MAPVRCRGEATPIPDGRVSLAMNRATLFDDCMAQVRGQALPLVLFSFAVNLLLLVSSVYMLQVIDRVLSSGSLDTLLWLTAAAVVATAVYGVLELVRRRLLSRTAAWLDAELAAPVIRRGVEARLAGSPSEAGLTDLQELRSFLSGDAILAFLDAFWMPIFIAVIWLMHPVLGWLALTGAVILFVIAVANDLRTRSLLQRSRAALRRNQEFAQHYLDHAETVRALGMLGPLLERWQGARGAIRDDTERAVAVTNRLTYLTKSTRLALQILILGAGAWLVLQGELTGGGMIATSVILSRALSPVERALGAWRSYVSARTAYGNLAALFRAMPSREASLTLPKPSGQLTVRNLSFHPRAAREPIIKKVDLLLEPGETFGILGPSGSGKSTLCRLIVGASQPTSGQVRLDGADVTTWNPDRLGQHIGYLSQTVDLFPGTIAQNIARMQQADDSAVIEAAMLAGAHEMILQLPDGYDTELGAHGHRLSGGQKQRIGLARALFGDPVLIVLDEPNANLDSAGEQAVHNSMIELKRRSRTVLIVTHKPSVLRTADRLLVLNEGRIAALGARDQVLRALLQTQQQQVVPLQPQRAEISSAPHQSRI
jgi:ATP-binding cassette subfamily C exporter for protease/lipase